MNKREVLFIDWLCGGKEFPFFKDPPEIPKICKGKWSDPQADWSEEEQREEKEVEENEKITLS